MKRGDVSFTFLSRIQEIEWNIQDGRWQSALALALTLPDICGGIEYPELIKKYRDGRIMVDRYGEPTRDVGAQYILWFDTYASGYFKRNSSDEVPYISGERCWQLRCEYLHQNKGFVNEENGQETYFHLGINCGASVCMSEKNEEVKGTGHIRLDIHQMCMRMCLAARDYYENNRETKDFSLYHTPVLDFIQWAQRGEDIQKTVAVICRDRVYARGIQMALKQVSSLVEIFKSPEAAKTYLKKKKPAVWIITEEMMAQKNQPWRMDAVPVILISEEAPKEKEEKYIWIQAPFAIDRLRNVIREKLS